MQGLYQRIESDKDEYETDVRLSYLEIYNETIRDLLSDKPTPPGPGLALREDAANKISVVGITEHTPTSPEEVLMMITGGNQRRTQSPTDANAVSSRSHAVLQVNVTRRPRTADTIEEMTSASLNIIDLAGSERASATNNHGLRMKEGANINRSLLALGSCINALCQTGGARSARGRHVPYRNSKLTRLLKFSLGGNCKTVMIACVSPSSAHYDETHNTLKYANQAKNIQTKVSRNLLQIDRHVAQYVQAIASLRAEVAELKDKLAQAPSSASSLQRAQQLRDAETRLAASVATCAADETAYAASAWAAAVVPATDRLLRRASGTERDALERLRDRYVHAASPALEPIALASEAPPLASTDATCAALYDAMHAQYTATAKAQQAAAARDAVLRHEQETLAPSLAACVAWMASAASLMASASSHVRHDEQRREIQAHVRAALALLAPWLGDVPTPAMDDAVPAADNDPDAAADEEETWLAVDDAPRPASPAPRAKPSPRRVLRPSLVSPARLSRKSPRRRLMRTSGIRAAAPVPRVAPRASLSSTSAAPGVAARPPHARTSDPPGAAPRPSLAPRTTASRASSAKEAPAPRPSGVPPPRASLASGPSARAPRPSVARPTVPVARVSVAARPSLRAGAEAARPKPEAQVSGGPQSDLPTRGGADMPSKGVAAAKPAPRAAAPDAQRMKRPSQEAAPEEPRKRTPPWSAQDDAASAALPPRRGLFQRQFLARPEHDEADDSLLPNTSELADLSAIRQDLAESLVDLSDDASATPLTPPTLLGGSPGANVKGVR